MPSERSPSAHEVKREIMDETRARIARRSQSERELKEALSTLTQLVEFETTRVHRSSQPRVFAFVIAR